jgi:cytochrome c553
MLRRMAKKNPAPIDRLPSHQLRVHMVLQMLHTFVFYIQRSSEIPPGLTLGFTRKFQRVFYESGPPETPGTFRCMSPMACTARRPLQPPASSASCTDHKQACATCVFCHGRQWRLPQCWGISVQQ